MSRRQDRFRAWPLAAILSLSAWAAACEDGASPLAPPEEPPDAGCIRAQEPHSFQVYFVIDVSGSMEPFLNDLKDQLVSFASGFARFDGDGRPVRIDYYLVAYVNDVKWYGGRMTSVIAVQAAFDEAIARGQTNMNLRQNRPNAEPEENMLDALQEVVDSGPTAEGRLILLAGDAPFVEAPTVLSYQIPVRSTFAGVRQELADLGARIHAFVPGDLDGVTRTYDGQPSLTSLPGSTLHSLRDLTGAGEQIRSTLSFIAREASCN